MTVVLVAALILVIFVATAAGALLRAETLPKWGQSVSSNGIELWMSLIATNIKTGQELNVAIALYNTRAMANNVTAESHPAGTAGNWSIGGWPVAIWPVCDYSLPVQFVLVKGYVTLQGMKQALAEANPPSRAGGYLDCMEWFNVHYAVFESNSDIATLVGTNYGPAIGTFLQATPSYRLATNFTVGGYWDYPLTSAVYPQGLFTLSPQGGYYFAYPEVSPTLGHVFSPGDYTVIAADEWGNAVLLHFTVT